MTLEKKQTALDIKSLYTYRPSLYHPILSTEYISSNAINKTVLDIFNLSLIKSDTSSVDIVDSVIMSEVIKSFFTDNFQLDNTVDNILNILHTDYCITNMHTNHYSETCRAGLYVYHTELKQNVLDIVNLNTSQKNSPTKLMDVIIDFDDGKCKMLLKLLC